MKSDLSASQCTGLIGAFMVLANTSCGPGTDDGFNSQTEYPISEAPSAGVDKISLNDICVALASLSVAGNDFYVYHWLISAQRDIDQVLAYAEMIENAGYQGPHRDVVNNVRDVINGWLHETANPATLQEMRESVNGLIRQSEQLPLANSTVGSYMGWLERLLEVLTSSLDQAILERLGPGR